MRITITITTEDTPTESGDVLEAVVLRINRDDPTPPAAQAIVSQYPAGAYHDAIVRARVWLDQLDKEIRGRDSSGK